MLFKKREKFSGFSIKVGIAFSKLGMSPNQWTILSLIPALLSLYFLIKEIFLYAAICFAVAAFIDLVDGSVARVTGRVSKLGAYLDTIVDRYIEGMIIFGLLFASLPGFYFPIYSWVFLCLFGSMMTTYAKAAAAEKELTDKQIKGGLFERAERLILLFIGIVLAVFDRTYLTYAIVLLAALSNITALQRIFIAIKAHKKHRLNLHI